MSDDLSRARVADAGRALKHEVERRKRDFAEMQAEHLVEGRWGDNQWSYRGRNILFGTLRTDTGKIVTNRNVSMRQPLAACSAELARCITVSCMARDISAESVLAYLTSLRYLDDIVGPDLESWSRIAKREINAALDLIKEEDHSPFTVYARASHIGCVIKYLNSIQCIRGSRRTTFLPVPIRWRHGLVNPTKSWLEQSGDAAEFGTKRRAPDGLENAIGELRAAVRSHPDAEPKPGFDTLRLNSLSFPLGMGIRVNEITTLPLNCHDVEPQTGSPYLRVWTEKGELPVARPVPLIWNPIYREVIDDVVEKTAAPRKRAREIEESGFAFVFEEIAKHRTTNPFSAIDTFALTALGFDIRRVAWPTEIEEVFREGTQRFYGQSGAYVRATFFLPPIRQCCIAKWIDERIQRWDWQQKRLAQHQKKGDSLSRWLVLADVASDVGISISSAKRVHAGDKALVAFVKYLEREGVQPGKEPPGGARGRDVIARVRRRWATTKQRLMTEGQSHESRRRLVAIDRWIPLLEERYAKVLRRHFGLQDVTHFIGGKGTKLRPRARLHGPQYQPLSEHLFVVWENSFSQTNIEGILPQPLAEHDIYCYLSTKSVKDNAFARFGIMDADGKPFSISPHQIRHWLTTALLRSGPNQMIVDLWMGRTPGQSRIYDHRTPRERAEVARQRYLAPSPPNDYFGKLVTQWRTQGVSEAEIAALITARIQILHFTIWGACTRELAVMPCLKALACVRGFGSSRGCRHFSVNYDDLEAKANLEQKLVEYQGLLLALEPRYPKLRDKFAAELNTTEPLDQHLMFLHDMVEGIKAVLHEYKVHAERAEQAA